MITSSCKRGDKYMVFNLSPFSKSFMLINFALYPKSPTRINEEFFSFILISKYPLMSVSMIVSS